MKKVIAAYIALTMISTPVIAHHSVAMFDNTQEILIEGTVTRFEWTNPHMYLIVEAEGPDGESVQIRGEGVSITQALVDGLSREALQPGMPVIVRANPNRRGGFGRQVRILDVTTEDGEIHPFYAANTRTLSLTPAESLEGNWAPSRQALGAAFGAMARWLITPEARTVQSELAADGICFVEPMPFLVVLDELRTIEIGEDEILMRFDNSGDHVVRTIHMNTDHPADVELTVQGHSIGWWEGNTLVIDTIAYEPNPSGIGQNVPSSASKHSIERLTITDDRLRLRYEATIEDPVYLEASANLTMLWDHRPDLEFSPPEEACDSDVALKYLED